MDPYRFGFLDPDPGIETDADPQHWIKRRKDGYIWNFDATSVVQSRFFLLLSI
jgi:hypothetical protein